MKILAKELDIPVIAVCQLNRGVEKRDVKRPTLADLRDSGRIEEDADVILMLYRSEYYLRDLEPDLSDVEKYGKWQAKMNDSAGRAEVIVAKNRHGETSAVKCLFMKETMEFKDA